MYSTKHQVLEDICLTLDKGHVYGLLGKNGEGKTTLLKLLCGLLIPNKGECLLWGQNVTFRPVNLLQKLFFTQEMPVFPDVRVHEYFKMYAPFYPSFSNTILKGCIEQFELDGNLRITKGSLGQQKKVLISMALSANTPLLLLDEPTNGLDIPSKRIFRKLLASYVGEESIVVISTHQVRDLDSLIDSVIILDDKKVAYSDSLDNVSLSLEDLFEDVLAKSSAVINR